MPSNQAHIDEEEIDIKEVSRTIYRYMIFLFLILFATVSSYYVYFQPNIYKASSTVEVGLGQRGGYGSQDILAMVMDSGTMNADTSIYGIRAGYSKKGFLHSIEKLSKEEISGLGILLNDVKMAKNGYGYGYYEEDKK